MSLKDYLDGLNGIYTGSSSNQAGLDQRYQRQAMQGCVSPLRSSLQLLGERSKARRAARKLKDRQKREAREQEKLEARQRETEHAHNPGTRPTPRFFTALLAIASTVAFSYYVAPLLPTAWWSWAVAIALVGTVPLYYLLLGPLRIVTKTVALIVLALLIGGLTIWAVIIVRMMILTATGHSQ